VADGRGYAVAAHDVVLRGACQDCRPASILAE
jgi:Fe2+ or Zn2+ uptake regulation protein